MKKKEKEQRLESIDFEGDLVLTIKYLQKKMKDYRKEGYIKFSVNEEKDYDYYRGEEAYTTYELIGTRLETDAELQKRIEDNKRRSKAAKLAAKTKAIKKEERERKQLKKLQEKYKDIIN